MYVLCAEYASDLLYIAVIDDLAKRGQEEA